MEQPTKDEIIGWLCGETSARIAVVGAHPDDETVGLGARLAKLHDAAFIIVSDGAPGNLADARAAGFATRDEYADARRQELRNVLLLCGISRERVYNLHFVDQQVCLNLIDLVRRLVHVLRSQQTEIVITHPYEGGHPDHDAVALAVQAACRILQRSQRAEPRIIEMTSYHLNAGKLEAGVFLPQNGCEPAVFYLSEDERLLKRRLLALYRTQSRTLSVFPIETEQFRAAPRYDFTRPPHSGPLLYDCFNWGVTSAHWQELAVDATQTLECAWD